MTVENVHEDNQRRIREMMKEGAAPDTTAFVALKLDALISWLDEHWAGEANLADEVDAAWADQVSQILNVMEAQLRKAKLTEGISNLTLPGGKRA